MNPKLLVCSRCGEENPDEAVMCWNCYAPLTPQAEEALRNQRAHQRQVLVEQRLGNFFDVLPMGGLLLLVASGYIPKRRVLWAGLGLGALAASWIGANIKDFRIERRSKRFAAELQEENEPPIQSILNTILLYAVRDGASQIRLRVGTAIQVHYLINGEWVEQMKIPGSIWEGLRSHLIERSESWTRPIVFNREGISGEFSGKLEHERDLPLVTVTLTREP